MTEENIKKEDNKNQLPTPELDSNNQEQNNNMLVAILPKKNGTIDIIFQGLGWDEAYLLIEKARVKMHKEYERHLQGENL